MTSSAPATYRFVGACPIAGHVRAMGVRVIAAFGMVVALATGVQAQMISGTYAGDSTDNRAISGLSFQPDVVITKVADDTRIAVIRTSTMSGDLSKNLKGATSAGSNMIQSLNATGFTVGSDDDVNKAARTFHYTAFEARAGYLVVGTYTGNGSSSRNITGLGFSPELVFVMSESGSESVFHSSGAAEAYNFDNSSGNTGWITALGADGFTVSNDSRVNSSGTTYHYVAWNAVAGLFDVATYAGNGSDNRNITTPGFQPEWVIVKSFDGDHSVHHAESQGAGTDETLFFRDSSSVTNRIQQLISTGFQVGTDSDVNLSGRSYTYMAWSQQTAPSITDISDRGTDTGTPTAAIPFTIADAETAASLTVTGSSSNTTLVPNGNIVFGGSDANRTVTVTPAASQTGTATITVTVSDGDLTTTDTFVLSVTDPAQGVQSGTTTIAAGTTSTVVNITAVNLSRSFLVFSSTVNDSDPEDTLIRGQITSPTTIAFTRYGTGPVANIQWSVVQYASGVSVQRGTISPMTGTLANVTVSSVDTTKAIPIITFSANGVNHAGDDFLKAKITSSTNLELATVSDINVKTVEWQIVEFTNAAVKTGDIAFLTTDASKTATIAAVTTAKSWLTYTYSSDDGTISNIGQMLVRGRVTNSTTLTFDRNNTGQVMNLTWYLVEFTDSTTVQHGTAAFTTVQTQQDVTISSVDTSRSFAVGGYYMKGGRSTYAGDDNPGVGWMTHELTSATNLRIRRALTGSSTADMGWFVVQIPNVPPTISDITNQATNEDTPIGPIAFTVGDLETPEASLTVSGSSSDQAVVPNANVVFGGSGANRTVTLTPAANASGVATITVTVNDGSDIATDTFTLTVNAVNDPPTITDIADQVTTEDTATGAIAFTIGDVETPAASLTMSGSSSNTTVVPNGNIVFGGSGASRTVTVTPAADQTGTATITVTVSDGTDTATDTFVLTVTGVNDPPTISDIADQGVNEDTATGAIAFTIGDVETAAASLTVAGSSSNTTLVPNGNIVLGGSGASRTVTVTPAADQTGTATITVTVSDGTDTATDTFVLTVTSVNDPPTISDIADQGVNEDTATGGLAFTIGDVETPAASLTVSGSSSNTTLVPNGNIVFGGSGASRTVTVTPAANLSGVATITVTVSDGSATATDTFDVTVTAVNDAPVNGVPTISETAVSTAADGAASVVAVDLDGDGDQDLVVASINDDTVRWFENDGAATPGFTPRTVTTTMDGVRDVFAIDLDGDTDIDLVAASTTDDSVVWFENDGAETFTPHTVTNSADGAVSVVAADMDGDTDIDLVVASYLDDTIAWYENDGSETFTPRVITSTTDGAWFIVVADVNGDTKPDVVAANWFENQVAWYESDGAALPTFTERSISTGVTGASSVFATDLDGDTDVDILATSFSGDQLIWFENDGSENFTSQVISSTVDGARRVVAANLDGDSDLDILSAAANIDEIVWYESDGQADPAFTARTITTAADATMAVTAANLDGDGDVDVVATGFNDDTVAWYESDGGVLAVTSTAEDTPLTFSTGNGNLISTSDADVATNDVQVTLTATNGTLTLSGVGGLAFTVGDGTADATMTFTGTVANANAAFDGTSFAPTADYTGAADLTIATNDQGFTGTGGSKTDTDTVRIVVTGVNDPPTISDITDQATNEDTPTGALAFTIGDAETPAASLTVTGSSSNTTLVPNGNIVFGGSGASRTVTVTPAAQQSGTATITVTVSDGTATATDTFVLTVNAVNDPPTISDITDQATNEDAPTGAIAFTIGDVETAPASLTVTGSSSNTTLVPNGNIVFGGSGASRTVTLTPAANESGAATITVTVSDGTATATDTFVLTVNAVNDPPTITDIADQVTAEDTATDAIAFTIGDVETAPASLTVTGSSSNTTLVPNGNIVFGGSGASRTVTVTPAANENGAATITVTVSDGTATVTDTFVLTVTAVNDPPTISDITDQATNEDTPTGAIAFTIGDVETAAASLTVSGSSSNQTLVTNGNLVFGGSGANRTVTITPETEQSGTTTITITVSDGALTTTDTFVLTVNGVNDPPTISDIADQATNENTPTDPIAFTVGDPETPAGTLTTTGSSSNQTLVPNANITFGGSGASRTVTVTPAPDATGTATITVTVSDGVNDTTDTFVLTVTVNTPPTISAIADQATPEDTATGPIAFTVGDAETAVADLTVTATSNDQTLAPDGNITVGGTGANRTVDITPAANETGTVTITVTVSDGQDSTTETFDLTVDPVNDVPTISDVSDQATNEDTAVGPIAFTVGDVETAAGSLTVTGSSSDQSIVPDGNLTFGGSGANRTVTILPASQASGVATITLTVSDGTDAATDTFVLTVSAVNDPPTISDIANQATNEDTPTSAIGFTIGDVETPAASLTVTGSSSDQTLVPNANIVFGGAGANRTVTVTPAADQNGSATITVTVSDGVSTGVDTFVLTVDAINDPPTISDILDLSTNEDTATAPIAFTIGDAETPAASLTVTGTSSNQTLVPNANIVFGGSGASRTVTITPAGDEFGTATITVTVSDGTATATDTFVLTVDSVNDPPTISNITDRAVDEDTSTGPIGFTVSDNETPAGSLTVTGSSSNTTLVPNANVVFGGTGASRTVTVTPTADQNGTATITVTVSDGTSTATDTFVLTVNNINDLPVISDIADQAIAEDATTGALAFTIGDSETPATSLTVSGSSSNLTLVPNANIVFGGSGTNRTVTVTPAADQTGTATITVTVSDGTGTATDTFLLTVTGVNDPPTISDITDQSTPEDTATAAIGFTVGDTETPVASLTVTGGSSNTTLVPNGNIVLGGSGASRTVTITPAADQTGTATITVTVSDGTATATDTFVLTVTAVDDPPTISDVADQSIVENTSTGALAVTIGDVETPAASLTMTGSSSDQTLVPDANIVFGGSGASRTVTVTPAASQTGTATITITVSDGTATATDTFVLTVTSGNTPPTISDIGNQSTPTNTSTGPIAFTVGDAETPVASLTVTGSSSNLTLVPTDNIVFGGSGASRTVSILPAGNEFGTATITVTVSDGALTATDTFVLTVSNGAPTISNLTDQSTPTNTSTGPIAFTVGDAETPVASLTVTGSSSDVTLVPTDNLVFGGSGANRTISILPAGDETGTATITVTVSDGTDTATDTFVLTVGTSTPPTISDITDQTTPTNTSTGPIAFTVGDLETPVASLTVSGSSSDQTLAPNDNIVFGGSGASRTVSILPAGDETGTATITVTVSDGTLTATDSFTLSVGTNTAPTISDIGNQSTPTDTATGAISFTVGDAETPVASLTVGGSSSDQALVPTANLVFGGSGASRTVTVTPATGETGAATITITVSDGTLTAIDSFTLTVGGNTAPTISAISDQVTLEDTATGAIAFTIGDAETAPASLTVTGRAADTLLIPGANLTFAGAGATRTVVVTPAADANGTTTVTVTVSDGTATATATFDVTVTAVNDAPTVSAIADQVTMKNAATGAIAVTVADVDSPVATLTMTATSADQALVPNGQIVIAHPTPTDMTLTVTPVADRTGTTTITVAVSDGTATATTSFALTVMQGHTLTITRSGNGAGRVISDPVRLDCGETCSAEFSTGEPVTLSVVPSPGSVFAGWSGPDACVHGAMTLTGDVSCVARFTVQTVFTPTESLDFNGDGLTDIFWYHPETGEWGEEFADGVGGFTRRHGQWNAGWRVTPGDFDGNGLTDVILYQPSTGVWRQAITDGRGGFTYYDGQWAAGWDLLTLALNQDARTDLLLYNPATGAQYGCVTTGPGTFAYVAATWASGWDVTRARWNADAAHDLLLYNRSTGAWAQLMNDAEGHFQWAGTAVSAGAAAPPGAVQAWSPGWTIAPAELTGDQFTDLVLYEPNSGAWIEAIGSASGFSFATGQFGPGWDVHVADVTGDGRDDVFLHNRPSGAWMEARTAGVGAFETAAGSWTPGYALQLMQLDGNPAIDALLYQPATGGWHTGLRTGPGTYRSAFGGVDHAGVSLVTRVPATLRGAVASSPPLVTNP